MTIAQYLRLIRDQWIAVLLLTVLGALGAGAFSLFQTPTYEAGTQLFVSTSGQSNDLGELTQGSAFTQQRVKSYTDLLTSSKVLDPVIRNLSLDATAEELATRVTATSPLDTVLINVTVADDSPARAADIANAIAVQFPKLVNELETRQGQAASPVKVSITRPAIPVAAAVSPRTSLNLALGLLVGLGLGIGAAVMRDSLDRTMGGRQQASELAGAPVLGAVMDDPKAAQSPLISHDAFSPRAEAFRQLRTNIRFLSVDNRVSSLVVTGSVPSEGKTTTAANIAITLAQSGESVVLIDADLRRPTVADLFGVPSGVGLTTVLLGDTGVDTALQRWREDLPLFVLAAGPLPPNPSELIGSARMADLIHHLTDHGMTVVVDSPPLLPVTDAAILARVTDGALVVTRVGSTKVDQFTTAVESLRTAGAPVLGVVLNRVPRRGRNSSAYGGYGSYGGRYGGEAATDGAGSLLGDTTPRPVPDAAPVDSISSLFPPLQPAAGVPAPPPRSPFPAPYSSAATSGSPSPMRDASRAAPPTIMSRLPENLVDAPAPSGPVAPVGRSTPEVLNLRHPVGALRTDAGTALNGFHGGSNGAVNGILGGGPNATDTAVNGTLNGAVSGAGATPTNGQPSPYYVTPDRPRGRRSAPSSEPG